MFKIPTGQGLLLNNFKSMKGLPAVGKAPYDVIAKAWPPSIFGTKTNYNKFASPTASDKVCTPLKGHSFRHTVTAVADMVR